MYLLCALYMSVVYFLFIISTIDLFQYFYGVNKCGERILINSPQMDHKWSKLISEQLVQLHYRSSYYLYLNGTGYSAPWERFSFLINRWEGLETGSVNIDVKSNYESRVENDILMNLCCKSVSVHLLQSLTTELKCNQFAKIY